MLQYYEKETKNCNFYDPQFQGEVGLGYKKHNCKKMVIFLKIFFSALEL